MSTSDELVKAAQLALEAAARRRKLATKVSGCGDGSDKRNRPTPTVSTKVTPEGKKPCSSRESGPEPRALNFSDADSSGGGSESAAPMQPVVDQKLKEELLKTAAPPAPALLRTQASPQQTATQTQQQQEQKSVNVKHSDSTETITYKPVTADGLKAFFDGIKRSPTQPTFSTAHLEANLPPPGVKLQPAPVPQIVPQEIREKADRNKREQEHLIRLQQMDEDALQVLLQQTKEHPLFKTYEQDVIQPEHDDCDTLTYFGLECPEEDICGFQMWLETQTQAAKEVEQKQTPVEQAMALPVPNVPNTSCNETPTLSQPLLATHEDMTTQDTTPDEMTIESQWRLLSDPMLIEAPVAMQQVGSLMGPQAPEQQSRSGAVPPSQATTPAPKAAPEMTPRRVEPLTVPTQAVDQAAFLAALRRKSTDDMSIGASDASLLSPAPQQSAAASPPPVTPQASSPPPSAPVQQSQPSQSPTTSMPVPQQVPEVVIPKAPSLPPQPPVEPQTPQQVPQTPQTPQPSQTPQTTTSSDRAQTTPSADGDRAAYMRFYRSVRSSRAPEAVTKRFAECASDPSGRAMKALFAQYLECSEDWLSSNLVLTESSSNTERTGGRFGWLSKADLLQKYHNNSGLVEQLIDAKFAAGSWKDHPEFPGNIEQRLYRVWLEDFEVSENVHSRTVEHSRDATGNYEYEGTGSMAGTPGHDTEHRKGSGKKGKGKGKTTPTPKSEKNQKKEKTEDQLVRAAIVKVNANLLELSQWQYKLSQAGVAKVVANAFVSQMNTEADALRAAKNKLESDLAAGNPLKESREALEKANEAYRTASVQVPKHVAKPKAKPAAAPTA